MRVSRRGKIGIVLIVVALVLVTIQGATWVSRASSFEVFAPHGDKSWNCSNDEDVVRSFEEMADDYGRHIEELSAGRPIVYEVLLWECDVAPSDSLIVKYKGSATYQIWGHYQHDADKSEEWNEGPDTIRFEMRPQWPAEPGSPRAPLEWSVVLPGSR